MTAPSSRKRSTGSPGAKILVTAGALAATLAGWAALTWRQAAPTAAATPGLAGPEAQLAAAGVILEPLPTLVSASSVPVGGNSVASPQRGARQVLRSVSAPPAPVVMTRSSRP